MAKTRGAKAAPPKAAPPPVVEKAITVAKKRPRANTEPEQQRPVSEPSKAAPRNSKKQKLEDANNSVPDDDGGGHEYKLRKPVKSGALAGGIKKVRRTTAQVDKESAKYDELVKQIQELEAKKMRMAAQFDIQQEEEEAAEEAAVVTHASQVRKNMAVKKVVRKQIEPEYDAEDEDEEFFDMMNADGTQSEIEGGRMDINSDVEDGGREQPTKDLQRKKKPARGEVKAAIEMEKERLRGPKNTDDVVVKKQATDKGKSTSLTIMKRPAHLSGFQPNFKSTPAPSQKTKTKPGSITPDEDYGGLQDDDVFSAPPETVKKGNVRNNDNITYDILSSSEEDVKPKRTRKAVTATKTPASRLRPVTTVKSEGSSPSVASTPSPSDTNALPDFITEKWTSIVLPTLYHRFFTTEETFTSFGKGTSSLHGHVIRVLKDSLPNHSYQFKMKSAVMDMAYNRCTEKRSFFGIRAVTIVDDFFKQSKYAGHPERIAQYAKWAVQPNGPALWATPSPDGVSEGMEGYKRPRGLFESKFVIDTAAPLLRSMKGSAGDYGKPTGGLALAAAGVERAFSLWLPSGHRKSTKPKFSRESVGDLVGDYVVNTAKLSDKAWKRIEDAMGMHDVENSPEQDVTVAAPSLEQSRRTLFIPSSPAS
ncbi:hypothetical protein M413DRAFT_11439 [Hebeloma cylindrosporum]|uniref:Uncharacterized protein n=1 Tax=Hebeloma cylindrosporum TaxID=76867 RepID=A0A0C3C8K1_HEBCY|nr:hypothetical protein M413DRAFT_11439 [Hebeloma cylindrosporum h7]